MRRSKENKRAPGKNEPQSITKMEILLKLCNSEKKGEELRAELKNEFNISEKRGINLHLKELEKQGFISKRKDDNDKRYQLPPLIYFIKEEDTSYDTMKKLYLYFEKNQENLNKKGIFRDNYVFRFFNTNYVQNHINDKFFEEFVKKLIIKFFNYMFELFNVMYEPEKYKNNTEWSFFIKKIEEEISTDEKLSMVYINYIKNHIETFVKERNNLINERFKFEEIKTKTYDEISKEIDNEMVGYFYNLLTPNIFKLITNILFPNNKNKDALEIIKCSLSAFKFIITIDTIPLPKINNLIVFYMHYYVIELRSMIKSKKYNEKINNIQNEKNIESIITTYTDIINDMKPISNSPLLQILKGLLISDIYINNNYRETEWWKNYLMNLLIENPEH